MYSIVSSNQVVSNDDSRGSRTSRSKRFRLCSLLSPRLHILSLSFTHTVDDLWEEREVTEAGYQEMKVGSCKVALQNTNCPWRSQRQSEAR